MAYCRSETKNIVKRNKTVLNVGVHPQSRSLPLRHAKADIVTNTMV